LGPWRRRALVGVLALAAWLAAWPAAWPAAAPAAAQPGPRTPATPPAPAAPESAPASAPAAPASTRFRAAEWQVRQGQWSFADSGELECAGRGRSALVYHATARPRDLDVTVEVMFLGPESSAGIVFRAAGEPYGRETFYQFEWYTRGTHHDRRLSLMVKNPNWKQIVTPTYPEAPYRRWIALRVRAVGDMIECFVDGRLAFRQRDRTYRRAGRVGLHVWQPRAVNFRAWRLAEL
jgi:hypothetical protein